MASTRNLNTRGDYALEQQGIMLSRNYNNYLHAAQGCAFQPSIPTIGYMPNHMPRHTLSRNPIDIESALFGINSTNLVNPAPPLRPDLICLKSVNLYGKPDNILPVPLVVSKEQRPFPIP